MPQALTAWDDPEFVEAWNATYGLDMRHAPIRGQFVFPWIASHIGNPQGKRLIDIGCGNGNLIRHFHAAAFAELVGIDPGKAVIESAREGLNTPNVKFVHTKATEPLPVAHTGVDFDVATSVFVVEEIPHPHFQAYCSAIRDVLKDKGLALVFTNHPANALAEDLTAQIKGEPNRKFAGHEGYFDRAPNNYTLEIMNGEKGFAKKAAYHHKPVADILNAFAMAGLSLRSMVEVPRGVVSFGDYKNHTPCSGDIPRFAGFVFQKT
ncbi:MAG: class I SAM-dependent methyltransferase [Pseudobdellovibrionaceae bacterium]